MFTACGNRTNQHNADASNFDFGDFPKTWERFGITNNDTVSYQPCNASNPQFIISPDAKKIQIMMGNEVDATCKIISLTHSDKTLTICLDENKDGIKSCTFTWVDKKHFVGKWYLNNESDNTYEYLPKYLLDRHERITEKCNDEQ